MRPSSRLLQASRITLFTRPHCDLCSQAKTVLGKARDTRPFAYREIDIAHRDSKSWRDLYDFDVPVIHISRASTPDEEPGQASKAVKLMHRFTVDEVLAKLDAVEQS